MPLKKGSSQSAISNNIEEMMKAYEKSGKIGNTTPKNDEHARKIATAAAYKKAGKSKTKKKFKNFLESLTNRENSGIIETLNRGFVACMESISQEDARRIAFDLADENTPELHLLAETGTINDKEALSEEIEGNLNALIISEMDPFEKESMENQLLDLQDFVSNMSIGVMESVTLKYTYKGQPVQVLKNKGMDEEDSTEIWTVKLPDGSSVDVKSRDLKAS